MFMNTNCALWRASQGNQNARCTLISCLTRYMLTHKGFLLGSLDPACGQNVKNIYSIFKQITHGSKALQRNRIVRWTFHTKHWVGKWKISHMIQFWGVDRLQFYGSGRWLYCVTSLCSSWSIHTLSWIPAFRLLTGTIHTKNPKLTLASADVPKLQPRFLSSRG